MTPKGEMLNHGWHGWGWWSCARSPLAFSFCFDPACRPSPCGAVAALQSMSLHSAFVRQREANGPRICPASHRDALQCRAWAFCSGTPPRSARAWASPCACPLRTATEVAAPGAWFRRWACAFAWRLTETPYSAAHGHFVAERLRVPTAHGQAHPPTRCARRLKSPPREHGSADGPAHSPIRHLACAMPQAPFPPQPLATPRRAASSVCRGRGGRVCGPVRPRR